VFSLLFDIKQIDIAQRTNVPLGHYYNSLLIIYSANKIVNITFGRSQARSCPRFLCCITSQSKPIDL